MAKKVSNDDIEAMPILAYYKLRQTLRSGDLIFTSGDYLISRAIRQATGSPWSHVGIIFKINELDRILLLESVEDAGVRLAPLSKYLKDYDNKEPYNGKIVIARCNGLDASKIKIIARSGIDELARPYDKDEIVKIMARVIFWGSTWERDSEYICSELVDECFSRAGIIFKKDDRGFISPENIWIDEKVEILGRIL